VYLGEFEMHLERGRRTRIPAKFRSQGLPAPAHLDPLIVVIPFDKALTVYPLSVFRKLSDWELGEIRECQWGQAVDES
jgi:DNA-binding transcriptional regulator/RsmH inhibitor MraZ